MRPPASVRFAAVGSGRVNSSTAKIACLFAFGITALLVSGCQGDGRDNQPRPPVPTTVSVQVVDDGVDLSPVRVGFEPVSRQQVIRDERDGEIQAPSNEPLPVKVTIANTTPKPIRVVLSGPARRVSPEVTATGTGVMSTRLPTGIYRVQVAGRDARAARLVVGPDRSSPQNDLLLP